MSNRLFVANISEGTSAEDIRSLFSSYGKVHNVWLSQNPTGFGFIDFENEEDAEVAVTSLDGTILDGLNIRVEKTTAANTDTAREESQDQRMNENIGESNISETKEESEKVVQSAVEQAVDEVFEDIKEKGEKLQKLSSQLQQAKPRSKLPNMFGKLPEENLVFCIDTSGSMYGSLDAVKEHLVEALQEKTKEGGKFNLIEFNTEVTQWSDRLMNCDQETVALASDWINNLEARTGTNTLKALLTALADPECDAVHLITDGYPDQQPTEILDNVSYVSNNRPIHCHYIQSDTPDVSAVEFLKDLAMESYGSLYIARVSHQGVIGEVMPVYRAEAAAERIIRTSSGNIYPSNYKECSVASTLEAPVDNLVLHTSTWPYPVSGYTHPFFHYYYVHPAQGWSQYRPSRSWMKTGDEIHEISGTLPFTAPGPGTLLIGTKVLARRHHNGLYYLGTVKSQIFDRKFLIEFGPCKHGDYKKTSYQETFLFDIISHTDALRHAIIAGDRVLAPWEPEGEKYGPGIVITGQEKRTAKGGGEDEDLVVSFYNGRTATVARNTAVWIPYGLHQRVEFELKLPRNVRMELANTEDYPEGNLPGYPTTKVMTDLPAFTSAFAPAFTPAFSSAMYVPYVPAYWPQAPPSVTGPGRSRRGKWTASMKEEVEEIPGTGLTKDALNEKVMAQIMEHKMFLEDLKKEEIKERVRQKVDEKLLRRRDNVEDNTLAKRHSLDRSVTFDREVKVSEIDGRDSGWGSATDPLSDADLSDCEIDSNYELQDFKIPGRGRRTSRQSRPRSRERTRSASRERARSASREKKAWRYWGSKDIPELLESNHFGPYRLGPYEDTATPIPLEKRMLVNNEGGVEYTNVMSRFVEPMGVAKYDGSVRDSMYIPKPPIQRGEKQGQGQGQGQRQRQGQGQGRGMEISIQIGEAQRDADLQAQARREFRRRQILERRQLHAQRTMENDNAEAAMRDQHRLQLLRQLQMERQRALEAGEKGQLREEAKRAISAHTRASIKDRQALQRNMAEARDHSRQAMQQRRLAAEQKRYLEMEDKEQRRLAARQQRTLERNFRHLVNMELNNVMEETRDIQQRRAKAKRIQHFRQLEVTAQKHKELKRHVSDQSFNLFRSEVLP